MSVIDISIVSALMFRVSKTIGNKKSEEMYSLNDLNDCCLYKIFSKVHKEDLISLTQVTTRFKRIILKSITFNDEIVKCVYDQFPTREANKICREIRCLSFELKEDNADILSTIGKTAKSLEELEFIFAEDKHSFEDKIPGTNKRFIDAINVFLRKFHNLKKASFRNLHLDVDFPTLHTFQLYNKSLEYWILNDCGKVMLFSPLPNLQTIILESTGIESNLSFAFEIAKMKSIRNASFKGFYSDKDVQELIDHFADTNSVERLQIIQTNKCPVKEDVLNEIIVSGKLTNLKYLSLSFNSQNRGKPIPIKLDPLPNLKYLDLDLTTDNFTGVDWVKKYPNLKELNNCYLLKESDFYELETYLSAMNRALIISYGTDDFTTLRKLITDQKLNYVKLVEQIGEPLSGFKALVKWK